MTLLAVKNLDKKFGNHYALSKVSLSIAPGEVHALVGENGAGKSTFIKIITGVYALDGGGVYWQGQQVDISNPKVARAVGINVVHQDRYLIHSFTGYENLYLGLNYPKRSFGLGVDWSKMKHRAEQLRGELGIKLDLHKTAMQMSPPERTLLEIMRAMMLDCRLLILDEPTATLTDQESELLFDLIEKLTAKGTAILYVSHRMDEILRISKRITVFRNGKVADSVLTADTDKDAIIGMMTQNQVRQSDSQQSIASEAGAIVLQLKDVSTVDGRVKKANLTVREGEMVGIFGLAGSGRTELMEAIYGSRKMKGGDVQVLRKTVRKFSPHHSLEQGVVLIPEDRRSDALVMNMTIRENMTLPVLRQFSSSVKIATKKEKSAVSKWMDFMKVKATSSEQTVQELSGGNQQKVVFAKALLSKPILFLCDEPTQAVDVMTRAEIHRLLKERTNDSCAVLYVSSDLQEILDIADRIYVFHDGETVAELVNQGVTAEQILKICYSQGKDRERVHE